MIAASGSPAKRKTAAAMSKSPQSRSISATISRQPPTLMLMFANVARQSTARLLGRCCCCLYHDTAVCTMNPRKNKHCGQKSVCYVAAPFGWIGECSGSSLKGINGLKICIRVDAEATITLKTIPCSAGWFATSKPGGLLTKGKLCLVLVLKSCWTQASISGIKPNGGIPR